LAETERLEIWKPSSGIALAIILAVFTLHLAVTLPAWISALTMAIAFYCFAACAIARESVLGAFLSWRYLRWFGNISYSYYLVHGFIVVALAREIFRVFTRTDADVLFWSALIPVFLVSFVGGALLFVLVEKRYSLRQVAERTSPLATIN
jgi:exopolysaccharide production protein ExoZ